MIIVWRIRGKIIKTVEPMLGVNRGNAKYLYEPYIAKNYTVLHVHSFDAIPDVTDRQTDMLQLIQHAVLRHAVKIKKRSKYVTK